MSIIKEIGLRKVAGIDFGRARALAGKALTSAPIVNALIGAGAGGSLGGGFGAPVGGIFAEPGHRAKAFGEGGLKGTLNGALLGAMLGGTSGLALKRINKELIKPGIGGLAASTLGSPLLAATGIVSGLAAADRTKTKK